MADKDPIGDILNSTVACTQEVLGDDWKKIAYLEDITLNNKLCQDKTFGIRPLEANEISGTNKFVTLEQVFELVLVRYKATVAIGDSDTRGLVYLNQRDALCVYKKLATHSDGTSILTNNLTILEPEFLENGKVVVQRAQFVIQYRCEL